ncbi:MAG: hypothetical protein ACKVP0_25845 [Pirellulaceae bacterium]
MNLLVPVALMLASCSRNSQEYEELGKQGQVSTLLSDLKSGDATVRANSLTGLGFAAACANPARASEQDRRAVDPEKLLPAVDPVINSLGDDDTFVRYCAGYALRYLAESVEHGPALTRITDALIEHKPQVDNGDDHKHYVEGLTAIAARAGDFPELAAKAQAALGGERGAAGKVEAEGKLKRSK